MSIWTKRPANIHLVVPDWDEPCTDALRLPSMVLENGTEGAFRMSADGPLGKASEELRNLYKAYCRHETAVVIRPDGTSVEGDFWRPDEDLLVGKIFGQAFDPDMRIAFARCLLEIGANPAEIIAIGERAFAAYVQEEAERMTARAVARDEVDRLYGARLPRHITGKVLEAFRNLLITMTVELGHAPEVWGLGGVTTGPLVALKDVEAMVRRRLPRGPRIPDYVTTIGRRHFLTLNGLALFGYADLRDWYFEDEENERVSNLYFGLNRLQYHLLNATQAGRRALDGLFGSIFNN